MYQECYPIYTFFFVFPLFLTLTHILLSQLVMALFIPIFHPLPCACVYSILPTR